ncbi:MAG: tetratricopeptide repeat protein [Candidatus Heimdallarchaeota archaeon]|nr:tetratricopeptide repeat protein [Candidatus Heimdallarchaeota archaeon]MCG3252311.1 tetratricopeptide repeat protein [Candidatus Heimdallarchaeota archaeon]MCK4289449.1 tetratricopeptide repeat protein [Candidatus Heimdallarchaeota archaeon]
MSSSIQKQFNDLIQLISLGQFNDALDLVDKISKIKGLSKEDKLECLLLRVEIENYLGNYKKSLQMAENATKQSKELKNDKLIIKSLYWKAVGFYIFGDIKGSLDLIESALKLMTEKNLLIDSSLIKFRILLIGMKGLVFSNTGNYKIGLEFLKQAIELAEKANNKHLLAFFTTHFGLYTLFAGNIAEAEKILNRAYKIAKDSGNKQQIALAIMRKGLLKTYELKHKEALELYFKSIEIMEETGSTYLHFGSYLNIGSAYTSLFQFDKAIKYLKKALTFESGFDFMIYTNLAEVYYWKNELDLALEHYLGALEKSTEIQDRRYHPIILYSLVNIYVQKKQFAEAQQYLNQLEKIRDEENLKQYDELHKFASIQFYKASTDIRDWSKAVTFAEKFISGEDAYSEWRVDALYSILEIRLRELQINANEESLIQVSKQIDEVFQKAEEKQQHNMIVNLYRLKAQLALVELDVKKAVDMLVTARTIAKEKGLELLVQNITKEEKKLEEQISMWTKFQEQKLPLVDTLKQVSLENTVQNIAKDTVVEVRDEETGKTIEYRKLFALKI